MKILNFCSFSLLIIVIFFSACSSTDDGSYVEPITAYERVKGDWKVVSVKQVDEIAKAAKEQLTEVSLTNQFNFSTFSIQLNADANNKPLDYLISGTAPVMFPREGYWDLTYAFQETDGRPNVLNLYSDANKTQKIGELSVTTTPGATEVLELKHTRRTKALAFVSYVYRLAPNSEIND